MKSFDCQTTVNYLTGIKQFKNNLVKIMNYGLEIIKDKKVRTNTQGLKMIEEKVLPLL